MISVGAILVVLSVLFVAPLALGSFVVVQQASRPVQVTWFAVLSGLLVAALAVGALALVLAAR